jgi:S-methyl-5-thioribose-1-phosphate isomerase
VLPRGRNGGGYSLEGGEAVVDYCVRMRRLPADAMLDARLQAGSVEDADVERIAALLADFHAGAPHGPEVRRYGGIEGVRGNWQENFEQTEAYVGTCLSREDFDAIRAAVEGFLAENEALFTARAEAERIREADVAANHRMGELGAGLFEDATAVVTHCNTGSLATGGYGTALGVIRSAWARGLVTEVFAGETRPWLQGARLSAWELQRDGIPSRVIADAAAASLMRAGRIGWVITGADRVAANGDVANKIGTYALAVAAHHHGIPFMVVAPVSTIDANVPYGDAIPIEERDPAEVLGYGGRATAPPGARAWNPVFDITPAGLVSVLVTEAGVLENPDEAGVRRLLEGARIEG